MPPSRRASRALGLGDAFSPVEVVPTLTVATPAFAGSVERRFLPWVVQSMHQPSWRRSWTKIV